MRRSAYFGPFFVGLLCLIPVLIAIYHGPFRSYITTPDTDIVFVSEALRLNDNLPQQDIAHTGYIYFLLLAWWFKLLQAFNLIEASRLSELPSGEAFYQVYATLVYAGRWFSVLLSDAYIVAAYILFRQFTTPIRALMMTSVIATSLGLAVSTVVLRAELPSALFAVMSFTAFIAASSRWDRMIPFLFCLAGICALLSLGAKMQSILLLLGFPVLLMLLAKASNTADRSADPMPGDQALLWLVTGLLLAVPSGLMILTSIYHPRSLHGPTGGGYQLAIALGIVGFWLAYIWRQNIPRNMAISCAGALVGGLSLGLMSHLIRNDPNTVDALVKFGEHMTLQSNIMERTFSVDRAIQAMLGYFGLTLSRLFIPHDLVQAASSLVYYGCVGSIVWAAASKRYVVAVQATGFLLFALFLETAFLLRGGFLHRYLIYTEIWPLIGIALVAGSGLVRSRIVRFASAAGFIAIISLNIWASSQPWVVPVMPADFACGQMSDKDPRLKSKFAVYCRS